MRKTRKAGRKPMEFWVIINKGNYDGGDQTISVLWKSYTKREVLRSAQIEEPWATRLRAIHVREVV